MKPKGVPPVCTGNVRQIAGEVIGTREIVIDREFQSLLVPLSKAELSELRESILRDGCRDALVVWRRPDGKNVLLDGHNRYAICIEHGIEFRVEAVDLESREHALMWVEANQLGRRNLSDEPRAVVALSIMERRSKLAMQERAREGRKHGGNATPEQQAEREKRSPDTVSDKRSTKLPKKDTRAAVAKEAKIPERKLRAVVALKKLAVEVLGSKGAEKVLVGIRQGTTTIATERRELKRRETETMLRVSGRNRLGQIEGCGTRIGPYRCCTWVCGKAEDLLPELPFWSVSAVITDPPYGVDAEAWDGKVPYHLLGKFLQVTGGPVLWFGAAPAIAEAYATFDPKPERLLIWAPSFTLSHVVANGLAYRYHPLYAWRLPKRHEGPSWDVLTTPTECGNWWRHRCTKPLRLMEEVCGIAPPGGVVLDPFAGSGTTLLAARNRGRHFLGFESDPQHCEVIRDRLLCRPLKCSFIGDQSASAPLEANAVR